MVKLKERIKNKICLIKMTPNYPLGDFVRWIEAEHIDLALLSALLEEIQHELDNEAEVAGNSRSPYAAQHQAIKGYWCLYCSQVRAYYKAIIRDPNCRESLSFLLQ